MDCGTHKKHHHNGCCQREQSCGCGHGFHIKRHFLTKEEKIARLESYLQDLQTEAQAVQERIAAMQG